MSAESRPEVIIFDNLTRPTDVVGEYTQVKAKTPRTASEPFANTNAAGSVRQINSFSDIAACARLSGERLRTMLAANH